MKKIYIILSHSGTRFSKLINTCTRYEYTHVSISLDKNLSEFYSFGRRNMYLPFIAGFVQEKANYGVYKKFKDAKCVVFEMPITSEQYNLIKLQIEAFKTFDKQYHYNFVGIPFIMLKKSYERQRHFLCSQFVAYILNTSGCYPFNKDYTLVKPKDFSQLNDCKVIYKGYINNYAH